MRWQDAVVAAGAGVFAWAVLLLGGGLVLTGIDRLSPSSLLAIGLGLVLLMPLRWCYRALRGAGMKQQLDEWLLQRRHMLLLTLLLGLTSIVSFMVGIDGLPFTVLNLPYQGATPLLYRVKLLYTSLLGETAASVLFAAGQLYIELVWTYLLSSGILAITHKTGLTKSP